MSRFAATTVLILFMLSNISAQPIKKYYKSINNCNKDKDENCTYVAIDIAVVEKGNAASIINKAIEDSVIGVLSIFDTVRTANIEDGMKNFMNAYAEDSTRREYPMPWFLDITGTIENETPNILSYSVSYGVFSGGAHPYGYTSYFNIDPNTGNSYKLNDLFKPGYEKKLSNVLERAFRKQNEVPDDKSLTEYGLLVDKIDGTENFVLLKDGIMFFYNLYEIAPYVAGPSEINISYRKLKELISENSVIKSIYKK